MQITCPGCGFTRDVPDEKLPPNSSLATCPKCARKFKFRDLPAFMPYDMESPAERPVPAADVQPARQDRPNRPARVEPADFAADLEQSQAELAQAERHAPRPDDEPDDPRPVRRKPLVRAKDLLAEDFALKSDQPSTPTPGANAADTTAEAGVQADPARADEPEGGRKKPVRRISLDDEEAAPRFEARPAASGRPPQDQAEDDETPPERLGPAAKARGKAGELWSRLRHEPDPDPDDEPYARRPFADENGDDDEEGYEDADREVIPWENHQRFGFFPAFFLTLKLILTSPKRFFALLRRQGGGRTNGLVFFLIILEILVLVFFAFSLASPISRSTDPEVQEMFGQLSAISTIGLLRGFILLPLVLGLVSYVDTLFTILMLKVLRVPNVDFFATHRLICYSAAPVVIMAVPVAGGLLMPLLLVWNIVLQALGIREIHRTSLVYALAAALIKWTIYLVLLFAASQTLAR